MMKTLTLGLVRQGQNVLLSMKKRGFGVGDGVDLVEKSKNKKLDGAKRKLQEECGIYMYSKITRRMWYIHV